MLPVVYVFLLVQGFLSCFCICFSGPLALYGSIVCSVVDAWVPGTQSFQRLMMHREFSAGVHQRVQLSLIFFLFGKWFACRSASGVFLCAVCLSVSFVRVIYPLVGYLRCILCGGVSRRVVSRLCVDGRCLCLCFLGIVTTFLQAPLVLTGLRVLWVDLAPRARNKHLLSIILGFSSATCHTYNCTQKHKA